MIGAIIGDVVGSIYEFNNHRSKDFELIKEGCRLTDDSIMTMAVFEAIKKGIVYNKDKLISCIKKWGRSYAFEEYGGRFAMWLMTDTTKAYGSFGNGSAMRVSAAGWLGRSEEEVKMYSKLVTEITHNHPEGLKGAEVVAMCIYYGRCGKTKEFIKEYASKYYNLNFDYETLKKTYYFNETCQNTVPQAIYAFLISKDFEDCLRIAVSIGGDTDTLAAIACAIAESYYKEIDLDLIKKVYELIPEDRNGCYPKAIFREMYEEKINALTIYSDVTKKTKVVSIRCNGELSFAYGDSLENVITYLALNSNIDDFIKALKIKTIEELLTYVDYKIEHIGSVQEILELYEEEFGIYGKTVKEILTQNYKK